MAIGMRDIDIAISGKAWESSVKIDGEDVPYCRAVTVKASYDGLTEVQLDCAKNPDGEPLIVKGVLLPEEHFAAYFHVTEEEKAAAWQRFLMWQRDNDYAPEAAFRQVLASLRVTPEQITIGAERRRG